MARVFNNVLTSGVRGRIGNQLVFRVVNGVTIVSHAPAKPDRRKETEAQRKTRTTFRAATQWAKSQLVNPERRDYYTRLARSWNLTNAYTAAIKDYMCKVKQRKEGGDAAIVDNPRLGTTYRANALNKRLCLTTRAFELYDRSTPGTSLSNGQFSQGILASSQTGPTQSLTYNWDEISGDVVLTLNRIQGNFLVKPRQAFRNRGAARTTNNINKPDLFPKLGRPSEAETIIYCNKNKQLLKSRRTIY